MKSTNQKQASAFQTVVIDNKRFAVEERNGNISFNLSQMSKPFGSSKKPSNWLRSDESKRYLEALAKSQKSASADLVTVKHGGTPERAGTWTNDYHVAMRFAQWLDVKFAIQVDELIHKILTKQALVVEPFMGVYPTVIDHKAVYNYKSVLKALGMSTRSGSVQQRKHRHPNHFILLYGQNFITLDFCQFLRDVSSVKARQLQLNFSAPIAKGGSHGNV